MVWWYIGVFLVGGLVGLVTSAILASAARGEECAECERSYRESESKEDVYAPV